jgi:CubicO group peptidase (beta-lactamase class C family)
VPHLLGLGVLTAVAALGAFGQRERIVRLRTVAALFEPDRVVATVSAMDRASHSMPLSDGPWRPPPEGPPLALAPEAEARIADRGVTALVVLHDGAVGHESVRRGTSSGDLRISWSLVMSILSRVTGRLVADGRATLDDPVTRHAPSLVGSGSDGATPRDVLRIESGVAFDQAYADPGSDVERMGRVLAVGAALDASTAGLEGRWAARGTAWCFVSMGTHVISMVLRGATGRSILDRMAAQVTGPLGLGPARHLTTDAGERPSSSAGPWLTRGVARIG